MKTCFKCGEVKDLSFFYKHPQMADGYLNKCKECNKNDVKKNYHSNIEHYREYERSRVNNPEHIKIKSDYAKSPEGLAAGYRAKVNWAKRNPIKRMASIIANNAVRNGSISKSSICENCGITPSRIHGHHDDYAYALVVRWLCPGCHSAWHKKNGEGKNAN